MVAKTIDNDAGLTIENINQFYTKIDDKTLICRSFLMFMLHIRPEILGDEPYGFCDYAFVPEMVVHGRTEYLTNSNQIFIAELQDASRESEYIRRQDLDVKETARTIDYWATVEHLNASRNLLIFTSDVDLNFKEIFETRQSKHLDKILDKIYVQLRKSGLGITNIFIGAMLIALSIQIPQTVMNNHRCRPISIGMRRFVKRVGRLRFRPVVRKLANATRQSCFPL